MPEGLPAQLLALLLLAAAFALGRFTAGRRAPRQQAPTRYSDEHMRGLNYLLNERPDEAIDSFIASLAVNDETVETHLALGALVRRKGEVEKAIRLHQNLLARPGLSRSFRGQAELELARDYLAAGLLGRAENLLEQLAERGGDLRDPAEDYLLEVYEREREWSAAAQLARTMQRRGRVSAAPRLAQYLCEQAEQAGADDGAGTAKLLQQALKADAGCARARFMQAQTACDARRYKEAIVALKGLIAQDGRWLSVGLQMLVQAHHALGRERDLLRLLQDSLAGSPAPAAVLTLADHVAARDGEAAAQQLLTEQIQQQPSLALLRGLLERAADAGVLDDATLASLQPVIDALRARLSAAPVYRCEACGLAGGTLHWQCPGCKAWGRTLPTEPELA